MCSIACAQGASDSTAKTGSKPRNRVGNAGNTYKSDYHCGLFGSGKDAFDSQRDAVLVI